MPSSRAPVQTPLRSSSKAALFRLFRALERFHVHVMPRHFYSPVADRTWLGRNERLWRRPVEITGIRWDLEAQFEWLRATCSGYLSEVSGAPFLATIKERGIDFRYGVLEGEVLHCVMRSFAPRTVVEVGGGASTALIADAAAANASEGRGEARIVTVDPYASPLLERLERVEVLRVPAQVAPMELFTRLGAGDLLFIDSTHTLKTGSELPRLYLEVLPRLAPGVLVQIHDIFLPFVYSPWILSDLWDWQETTLLAALLTGNQHLDILCCLSALHHAMPEPLQDLLPDYRPRPIVGGIDEGKKDGYFPDSIWLRTK